MVFVTMEALRGLIKELELKVLVTGHLGYIGPIVIRMLHERGHQTLGLDVGYFDEHEIPCKYSERPNFEINADVRTVSGDVFEGVDGIIHLAAISNDPMGQLNPEITRQINYLGGMRVANLAKKAGVERFVFASSCSIYGNAGWANKPLDESAEFNPVSAYAVSKVDMEASLADLADDDFSPVFMRNATAFGVSSRTRLDLVVANLMGWGLSLGKVRVLSDGTPWRPLTHIEDIALGAVCALEADRDLVHNEAFNIGRNDANYKVLDIATAVAESLPDAKLDIVGEDTNDTRSYQVCFDKALNKLPGFEPQWDLNSGIEQLLSWFNNQDISESMMTSRNYIRLHQLQYMVDEGQLNDKLEMVN